MPGNLFWLCNEKKLVHLVPTGIIEGKRSRGRQQDKMLDGLTKWPNVGQIDYEQ